ncbi:hypothetical protein AB1Y20_007272 [Prymnesium parvum]|uniref:Lipoyl synthase, mitochondrial n=1 Tax=Prymnesium parvum TaxID=97485 RepID=A0AB34IUP1_PRYPA
MLQVASMAGRRGEALASPLERCVARAFSSRPAASGSRLAALRETLAAEAAAPGLVLPSLSSGGSDERRVRKPVERKPEWLRVPMAGGEEYQRLKNSLRSKKLATVCEEARCPNIGECWGGKKGTATATIMIMGDTCTRGCRFCNVKTSRAPPLPAEDEPENTADEIASWEVDYVVITSVDRDDLPDGGAEHYARVVRRVKARKPSMRIECLTPDFNGRSGLDGVALVARSGLDVYAHNIETVERLQKTVRDRRAGYAESMAVLEAAKRANPDVVTKSSIMLGLGEEAHEVRQVMRDMLDRGVEIFTLGQYLRPSKRHMPVVRMVPPAEYDEWQREGMAMGFKYVASGPLVRSSYKAGEVFLEGFLKDRDEQRDIERMGKAAPPRPVELARSGVWQPAEAMQSK